MRPAVPADVPLLVGLVRELADYERAAEQVRLDDDLLAAALFGAEPAVFAHVAELDAEVVGFALWFVSFSTWTGRPGIYLEDLYVRPAARRAGLGRALVAELARVATARGYTRLDFAVLDWNAPALAFYRSLGAEPLEEWTVHRVSGDALQRLGAGPAARSS